LRVGTARIPLSAISSFVSANGNAELMADGRSLTAESS